MTVMHLVVPAAVVAAGCGAKRENLGSEEPAIRRIVALRDYVAADYGGIVKDGAIVDETEYREQLQFRELEIARSLASLKERVGVVHG